MKLDESSKRPLDKETETRYVNEVFSGYHVYDLPRNNGK